MYIQNSPERELLTSRLSEEGIASDLSAGKTIPQVFDEIAEAAGLVIVEKFLPGTPVFDCADYVFSRVRHDKWYLKVEPVVKTLRHNPHAILLSQGFQETDDPQPGDVVAYRYFNGIQDPEFRHWGIYHGDGQVVAKFGNEGDTLMGDIGKIPIFWGEYSTFFRGS